MNRHVLILVVLMVLSSVAVAKDNGLQRISSLHSVDVTMNRLSDTVKQAGFRVFARIDHAAGAQGIGKSLRPTQLLIFGKPQAGSALMAANQQVGIDLPMKYLVWEDPNGKIWIGWNGPEWIARRHQIINRAEVINKMTGALRKFAQASAMP